MEKDVIDSLAERFGRMRLGLICDCGQSGTASHEPRCNTFKLAAEVRAFLAERVTVEKLAQAIRAAPTMGIAWDESEARRCPRPSAPGGGGMSTAFGRHCAHCYALILTTWYEQPDGTVLCQSCWLLCRSC